MAKGKLFDRIKKATSDIQTFASAGPGNSVNKYDWRFAPVMTDGRVNVGYKRSPLSVEEALGEGMQGPVDIRNNYKYQYIAPDGSIYRTAITPDAKVRWSVDDSYLGKYRGKYISEDNMKYLQREAELRGIRNPTKQGWGKDSDGNWYNLGAENVEIPLENAREMKKYWGVFNKEDMRGKKGDTRVAGSCEIKSMKDQARKPYGTARDPLAPSLDFEGETKLMAQLKKERHNNAMKEARENYEAAQDAAAAKRRDLEAQIKILQEKINSMKDEANGTYSAGREEYDAARKQAPYYDHRNAWSVK